MKCISDRDSEHRSRQTDKVEILLPGVKPVHHKPQSLQMPKHLGDEKEALISLFQTCSHRTRVWLVPDTAGGSLCSRTGISHSRPVWTAAGPGETPAGFPVHTAHNRCQVCYHRPPSVVVQSNDMSSEDERVSGTLTHSIRYRASSGRRCCLPFAVKPIVCQNFPCTNTTGSNTQRWSLAAGNERSSHSVNKHSQLESEAPRFARLESI